MMMKKGIVTLTALILLSGLLALILLFDEQIFAFFRAQMSKEYSFPLPVGKATLLNNHVLRISTSKADRKKKTAKRNITTH